MVIETENEASLSWNMLHVYYVRSSELVEVAIFVHCLLEVAKGVCGKRPGNIHDCEASHSHTFLLFST